MLCSLDLVHMFFALKCVYLWKRADVAVCVRAILCCPDNLVYHIFPLWNSAWLQWSLVHILVFPCSLDSMDFICVMDFSHKLVLLADNTSIPGFTFDVSSIFGLSVTRADMDRETSKTWLEAYKYMLTEILATSFCIFVYFYGHILDISWYVLPLLLT